MSRYAYTRLSAQDNDFLRWESRSLPMHGVGVQIFSAGPLARGGGVNFEAICEAVAATLPRVPRYRQKVVFIPGTARAVWVDDEHFQLEHHLRHVAVAHPGAEAQLRRLVAHIAETPLDRGRPLWECWVIEGLEGGRFAFVTKAHHCMVDGAGGMQLLAQQLSRDPNAPLPEAPRWVPKTPPSRLELRRHDAVQRAQLPFRLAREAWHALRDGERTRESLRERLSAIGELARFKLEPASDTPLNGAIGPHRVVDWASFPLAEAREAAHAHHASVNDFVLAIVTGALRAFFDERGVDPDHLDFRASCPVNVRTAKDRERAGNFVSSWLVRLPLAERDPLERLRRVHEATRALKERHVAAGVESLVALHEWLPLDLQALSRGAQNLVVTNVPGPEHPLYLRGAQLESLYALAPLLANVGLAIAATSYDGKLCVALNADEDRVPDVHEVVRLLRAAHTELVHAAAPKRTSPAPPAQAAAAAGPLRALPPLATSA
jgi:WS/DGAT/MGAT family acyltransferase